MKKWLWSTALLLTLLVPTLGHVQAAFPRILIRFTSMYGVDGPFLGEANPVRGIPGDDLPWQIRSVDGTVLTDGTVSVVVRGLVFPDSPEVPAAQRLINDEAQFRAVVSCLTEDGNNLKTVNVPTPAVPASRTGDAVIIARVKLPNPCVAPIVFIVPGDELDALALTGNEN